jgi:uncharacterized protein Yka (UPF0111/DUF47 family)
MIIGAITSAHAKVDLLHRTRKRRAALTQRRFLYGTGMMQERSEAMRFIPKEEKFFDLFEELADRIEAGGKLFLEMVESGAYTEAHTARLKEIEHEADVITHRTYEKMHTSFITPIDREDICNLVNKMDSILDMTEAAAARIILYRVKEPSLPIADQARILNEAIGKIKVIIHGLRDMKHAHQILQACVEVNTLENAGDVVLRTTMARLFENEPDVRELIKWKEIHERIEEAIDVCEDVSNIVEGIVLKNG